MRLTISHASKMLLLLWLIVALAGCQSPKAYRREADQIALDIIHEKQLIALNKTEPFSIERPSDTLRRRLLVDQNLPYAGVESLGSDKLHPVDHWPDDDYLSPTVSSSFDILIAGAKPLVLSLFQALQVAARNNAVYQTQIEAVFQSALDLDLERETFRNTFLGRVEFLLSTDRSGSNPVSGNTTSSQAGWDKKLASGINLSTALAVDLANLLTMGGASSLGLAADATITIPLMRGSGRHIVQEPLTQAERGVIYAIYDFERFKRTFSVDVARGYLAVLQQMDEVDNASQNYRSLVASARRTRRLADAGRSPEIQVDQAVQNELRVRNRWIATTQQLENRLDAYKGVIGLPPDARIELDRNDLQRLRAPAQRIITQKALSPADTAGQTPPADAPIELAPPGDEDAGPLEMASDRAIRQALANRLDLRRATGEVYDAQRKVVVAADALRAELTLLGTANLGEHRNIDSAMLSNAQLRLDEGQYGAFLSLDLPFERTAERNAYRESFIALEAAVRDVQELEDQIKLSIRNALRTLKTARESIKIQAQSVVLAQKRVRSINLFLEAGRAEVRDLLEAEEALFSTQNALTAAVVDYRIAELQLQQDMGLLTVDERGLWKEYVPEEMEENGQ